MTTITGTFLMVHFCRNGMERDETFVTTFVTNHNTGGWHLIDPVPLPILYYSSASYPGILEISIFILKLLAL